MAKFVGKNGSVKLAGTELLHITSWTCTTESEIAECTEMGAGGWKDFLPGMNSWSVEMEGYEDETDTFDWASYLGEGDGSVADLSKFTLELIFDTEGTTPQSIQGYAFLTGYGVSQSLTEVVTNKYTFQGIPDSAGVGPIEDDMVE